MRPRPVRPGELDRIARFCAGQFQIEPEYFLRRWRADADGDSFALVQELNGEVLGHIRVYGRRLWLDGAGVRCAALANVAVDAAHRGRGLARVLMEACLDECSRKGFGVSLLGTHIPALYERFGFQVVATPDALLNPGSGAGWYEAAGLTPEDRGLYAREHGDRPGTFGRDQPYWEARESWLPAEGWRLLRFRHAEGYCYVRDGPENGLVDEATGECLQRLRDCAPAPGRWRWRVPPALAVGLALEQTAADVRMARVLRPGLDLSSLQSPEAVIWRTDGF